MTPDSKGPNEAFKFSEKPSAGALFNESDADQRHRVADVHDAEIDRLRVLDHRLGQAENACATRWLARVGSGVFDNPAAPASDVRPTSTVPEIMPALAVLSVADSALELLAPGATSAEPAAAVTAGAKPGDGCAQRFRKSVGGRRVLRR